MPTGYTAAVEDGISFEEFALKCARAFGATISMRDDSMDEPIPDEFEVPAYHKDRLEEAKKTLEQLEKMTIEEAERKAKEWYEGAEKRRLAELKRTRDAHEKYKTMLQKARNWTPPSNEHNELRNFMISQLEETIRFDCESRYDWLEKEEEKLSGEEWLERSLKSAKWSVEHHAEAYEKDINNYKQRSQWVQMLRKSVKGK